MRQSREAAHGVEMEPVIPSRPRSANSWILLEDDGFDSPPFERGRGGKSRRARPNYDDVRFRHDTHPGNDGTTVSVPVGANLTA